MRRFAGIDAAKLGHGGIESVSGLFDIDPKTVRRGPVELEVNEGPAPSRIRKKVRDVKMQWFKSLLWKKISSNYLRSSPPAIRCVKCLMDQSILLRD